VINPRKLGEELLGGTNITRFSALFAKLRKATINFVMPVCLFVWPHGTARLPLDGIS
jgi:hypothetical protein